jgi:hypothetical protein
MNAKNISDPDIMLRRAVSLYEAGQFERSESIYDKLIKSFPDDTTLLTDLGSLKLRLGNVKEGFKLIQRSLKIDPNQPTAYYNQAVCLEKHNKIAEALTCYEQTIALDPNFSQAFFNKGLLKLLSGDFEEGWQLYEKRWACSNQKILARNFTQPLWLGDQTLEGRTLLIHPEQGYGDFIQLCRYIPLLEARGAKVVVETFASLVPLISTLKGNFTMVEHGKQLPAFDLHCPIMSLPLAFKTTVASIPANILYLYADPAKQSEWGRRLGSKTKPRVGLVWSGSAAHQNDFQRSIPCKLLKPLWKLPVEFHVLQTEIRAHDAAILATLKQVQTHQDDFHDFSDTAALVEQMDLVISVDTSLAHLAGALGKSLWILLPFSADYRWMRDRTDTPWYPSATLFRQPAIGDWTSVILEIKKRLAEATRIET